MRIGPLDAPAGTDKVTPPRASSITFVALAPPEWKESFGPKSNPQKVTVSPEKGALKKSGITTVLAILGPNGWGRGVDLNAKSARHSCEICQFEVMVMPGLTLGSGVTATDASWCVWQPASANPATAKLHKMRRIRRELLMPPS
jgi:hypothetical protein